MFRLSVALSWVLVASGRMWDGLFGGEMGLMLGPVGPVTLLWAAVNWTVGALPIVVARKLFLTGEFALSQSMGPSTRINRDHRCRSFDPLIFFFGSDTNPRLLAL